MKENQLLQIIYQKDLDVVTIGFTDGHDGVAICNSDKVKSYTLKTPPERFVIDIPYEVICELFDMNEGAKE